MNVIKRRDVLCAVGAGFLGACAAPAWAQAAKTTRLAAKLRIVIPSATRTNLDEVGRALGDGLLGLGLCDELEYENKEGKGGTLGLAYYNEKYSADPNALLMCDTTLVGAVALYKSAVDVARVAPVARLVTDTLVVVVAANSPLKTIKELADQLRSASVQTPVAMGAKGGVEHLFAGLLLKASGAKSGNAAITAQNLSIQSFARNFEIVDAVLAGKAVAGIAGYRAFRSDLASGKLRALAVSSKKAAYSTPSAREQGLDVDIANWQAVFTGKNVAAARTAEMVAAVKKAATYELWQKILKTNSWDSAWLSGADLASFIEIEAQTTQIMMQLLKLQA